MKYILIVLLCIIGATAMGQGSGKGPLPDDNGQVTPLKYVHLREADAMWTKRIWRVIDLGEKINLPFKYPMNTPNGERESLMNILCNAIQEGSITPYGYEDDNFTMPITWEKIKERGGARTEIVTLVHDEPPYLPYDTPITRPFDPDKVIGFQIKEDWFFDKQRSEMDVRIVGIAPLIYAVDEAGNIREGNYKIPLFWIYYPDARNLFANTQAFNRQGGGQHYSFDDLFENRFFSSTIIKESNVYDRRIAEYKEGLSALLEAEKIKQEITNFEHDLWDF